MNHGGQNSVMDGIAYGASQLVCPGKVFGCRFNAESAVRAGVVISLEHSDFNVESVRNAINYLTENVDTFRASVAELHCELVALGGADRVIDTIEDVLN